MREFIAKKAVREQVPLWFALIGPSGSGKTYSALRLATGMAGGGPIYVIDTEARRALHYADRFDFFHWPFGAPFSPLEYLDAIQQCAKAGAKVIVLDSFSHEHEGPGGVLEMHDAECDRLMQAWKTDRRESVQMSAWAKPKQERRQLINAMLQMSVSFVLCFRAKEKIKVARGGEQVDGKTVKRGTPIEIGWQAIGADEYSYEATARALLLPGCNGVPTWQPQVGGEELTIKLPAQFRDILAPADRSKQIDESMGEAMAKWARGGYERSSAVDPLLASLAIAADVETWVAANREALNGLTPPDKTRVRAEIENRRKGQ